MLARTLLSALLLAALCTGCSSIGRGGVAQAASTPAAEEEEEDFGPLPISDAGPQTAAAPGQTEVSWEDNGIPIRQLTGPGKPQELKLPDAKQKKAPAPKK